MLTHTDITDRTVIYTALVADFYTNILPAILDEGMAAIDATVWAWKAWRAWQHILLDTNY